MPVEGHLQGAPNNPSVIGWPALPPWITWQLKTVSVFWSVLISVLDRMTDCWRQPGLSCYFLSLSRIQTDIWGLSCIITSYYRNVKLQWRIVIDDDGFFSALSHSDLCHARPHASGSARFTHQDVRNVSGQLRERYLSRIYWVWLNSYVFLSRWWKRIIVSARNRQQECDFLLSRYLCKFHKVIMDCWISWYRGPLNVLLNVRFAVFCAFKSHRWQFNSLSEFSAPCGKNVITEIGYRDFKVSYSCPTSVNTCVFVSAIGRIPSCTETCKADGRLRFLAAQYWKAPIWIVFNKSRVWLDQSATFEEKEAGSTARV